MAINQAILFAISSCLLRIQHFCLYRYKRVTPVSRFARNTDTVLRPVSENSHQIHNQQDYQARYADLNSRYEKVKSRLAEVAARRQSRLARREEIGSFIETVLSRDALLAEFDEALWRSSVEAVKDEGSGDIRVVFRDGREIKAETQRK